MAPSLSADAAKWPAFEIFKYTEKNLDSKEMQYFGHMNYMWLFPVALEINDAKWETGDFFFVCEENKQLDSTFAKTLLTTPVLSNEKFIEVALAWFLVIIKSELFCVVNFPRLTFNKQNVFSRIRDLVFQDWLWVCVFCRVLS